MPHGNYNIAVLGADTRFGQPRGPDSAAAARKKNAEQHAASIRLSLRRLMEFEIDMTKPVTQDVLAAAFGRDGRCLTLAQACAVRKVYQALNNPRAMDMLIEQIDGKQVQATAEAKVTLADLVNASVSLERQQELSQKYGEDSPSIP